MAVKQWGTNLRAKTIRAFEEWSLVDENWEGFFRLIVEGDRMRLRDACVAVKQPYSLVYPFLHDGGAMQKRYEAALAALADDLMHERLEIADSVRSAKDQVTVAAAKLACDVRRENSEKWGRERYGEAADALRGGTVIIQVADLRGANVQLPAAPPMLDVSDAEPA